MQKNTIKRKFVFFEKIRKKRIDKFEVIVTEKYYFQVFTTD